MIRANTPERFFKNYILFKRAIFTCQETNTRICKFSTWEEMFQNFMKDIHMQINWTQIDQIMFSIENIYQSYMHSLAFNMNCCQITWTISYWKNRPWRPMQLHELVEWFHILCTHCNSHNIVHVCIITKISNISVGFHGKLADFRSL